MPTPDHTLWHPHHPHEVFEPLLEVLTLEQFDRITALADDNQRAIEDIVNNPTFTLPVHHVSPASGDVSDRFYIPETSYLVKGYLSITTAGSSTSTIDVFRNGAAITPAASFSAASSVHTATITPRQKFVAEDGDYVTVKATTVGTGAAGFVALLVFQPIA